MVAFSPEDARAFHRRLDLVAEREHAEQEASTREDTLDELERLLLSVRDFGSDEALDDDDTDCARRARLRKKLLPADTAP